MLRFRPWKDYSNAQQLLQTQGMGKTKEGRLEGCWLKAQDRSLWTGYVTSSSKWENIWHLDEEEDLEHGLKAARERD